MGNNIKFSKAELKAYPLLSKLEVGMRGIFATDDDTSAYKGLEGTVSEIRYGNEKETEKDSILEIVMDFEEPPHGDLEEIFSGINGTGMKQLFLGEDMVGFYFDGGNLALTLEGKIVCPDCHKALDTVTETQYDDITWSFENGEYHKSNSGASDGKKCPECNAYIEAEEDILGY
jgi:hypothetical protein